MSLRLLFVLLLATGVALAEDAPKTAPEPPKANPDTPKPAAKAAEPQAGSKDDKDKSKGDPDLGMSILGNQEAPKALVIVPWKSSEIGQSLGISTLLDDSRQPIDKDVFMRMLSYYAIRSNTTLPDGSPAAGRGTAGAERNTPQPAPAAHRRKS